MSLNRSLRLFSVLLVLVSVTAHEIGAEGYIYLLIAVAVGAVVFRQAARGTPIRMNDNVATFICLGAFAVLAFFGLRPVSRAGLAALDVGVVPVGNFLTIFQCVYLCREKRARDYFWMFLVTLVHMGTAGLLTPGVLYALFFIPYVALAICTLSLFHMWSEVTGASAAILPPMKLAGRPADELKIPRMSFLQVFPATLVVIGSIALLFVLLPRRPPSTLLGNPLSSQFIRASQPQVAGFSPTVDFREARGRIFDNPTAVMHVTLRDPETKQPMQMDQLLMRGTAVEDYGFFASDAFARGERHWSWQSRRGPVLRFSATARMPLEEAYENFPGFFTSPYKSVICEVELEPLGTNLIFAPFAPERVTSRDMPSFYVSTRTQYVSERTVGTRRRQGDFICDFQDIRSGAAA